MLAARAAEPPVAEVAPYRVSLVTIGPGELYWSRFGHNAIWVEDPATGASLMYNYGIFDLAEEGFLLEFARGRMRYLLAAFRAEQDLAAYVAEGRSVTVQRLALTAAQARELVAFLEWNRLPENRAYRYDYFLDNCSTRVRDALDGVLDGAIEARFRGAPAVGGTFRDHTNRLAAPEPLMYLGTDFGLGPRADRPIDRWEEFFLPMELAVAVREITVPDGAGGLRPLVSEEYALPVPDAVVEPAAPPLTWPWFALGGLVLAIPLALRGRAGELARRGWWLVTGTTGAGLLALWFLTDHEAAHANANALVASPLGLLLGIAPVRSRVTRVALVLLGLSVALAVLLAVTPLGTQRTLDWLLLLGPAQLAALVRRAAPSM